MALHWEIWRRSSLYIHISLGLVLWIVCQNFNLLEFIAICFYQFLKHFGFIVIISFFFLLFVLFFILFVFIFQVSLLCHFLWKHILAGLWWQLSSRLGETENGGWNTTNRIQFRYLSQHVTIFITAWELKKGHNQVRLSFLQACVLALRFDWKWREKHLVQPEVLGGWLLAHGLKT